MLAQQVERLQKNQDTVEARARQIRYGKGEKFYQIVGASG